MTGLCIGCSPWTRQGLGLRGRSSRASATNARINSSVVIVCLATYPAPWRNREIFAPIRHFLSSSFEAAACYTSGVK